MKNEAELFKIVRSVIAKSLGVPFEKVLEDSSQDNLNQWDSMSQILLLTELEGVFEVQFSVEEAIRFVSVKNIVETLKKYENDEIIRST